MIITKEIASEAGAAVAKLTPPAAVVTAQASGYTLQDWVSIATLVYLGLQALYLGWKILAEARSARAAA